MFVELTNQQKEVDWYLTNVKPHKHYLMYDQRPLIKWLKLKSHFI